MFYLLKREKKSKIKISSSNGDGERERETFLFLDFKRIFKYNKAYDLNAKHKICLQIQKFPSLEISKF